MTTLDQVSQYAGQVLDEVETGRCREAAATVARTQRDPGRWTCPDRGLSRARQDPRGAVVRPDTGTANSPGPSSRPTCCPAISPAPSCTTSGPRSSFSARARCSPGCCSPTSSTERRRRPRAPCSEAMQEGQITVEGRTFVIDKPFHVIATANPVEYEGTYPLPEAQLDRFLLRVSFGYATGRRGARGPAAADGAPAGGADAAYHRGCARR